MGACRRDAGDFEAGGWGREVVVVLIVVRIGSPGKR